MERPSRQSVNIRIAQIISERATCERLSVGAVITRDNRIISTGYNGPGKGKEHCNEFKCRVGEPCRNAIHAEHNAILNGSLGFMAHHAKEKSTLSIYVTHQPCLNCAKMIEYVGIREVYYVEPYRDNAGVEYLIQNGIKVNRIDEQGNPKQL